jgi:hypothetical protein
MLIQVMDRRWGAAPDPVPPCSDLAREGRARSGSALLRHGGVGEEERTEVREEELNGLQKLRWRPLTPGLQAPPERAFRSSGAEDGGRRGWNIGPLRSLSAACVAGRRPE